MSVAMPENTSPLDSTWFFRALRDSSVGWFSGFGCEKNAPSSRPSKPSFFRPFTTSGNGIGFCMYGPTQYAQVPIEIRFLPMPPSSLSSRFFLVGLLVIAHVGILLVGPDLRA